MAGVYRKTGKLDLAYETMKKAEKIAHSKQDLMNVYREIAGILRDMGKLDDALTYYNKTLNLARDLKDSLTQVFMLRDIADVYVRKGELDKALNYYNEALNLETFEIGKAVICSNIADIYDKKGDHQKSIEYRQKAIGYIQQAAKEGYLDEVYEKIYIGGIYQGMKDYKTAEKYFLEALNRAKKNEDKEGEANAYIALGDLYKDMGDKKRAKEYYQRAYKAFKALESLETGNNRRIQISNEADEVLKKIKELDKSK
ncbi:tetratricopeptide repeat protein [Sulfurihydrogenibium yellowstonense]|uniref:Tetratricopeptide repeat domain protein n=1 Tax=Sulfurihydrogenibium yellowstonense SS-5 TaxID=432331 RepID=C4FJ83_9AQUI|nr:tetratricopeptide repeat protein [Sulfurihydrogenibium yellowstonense]EEP60861.1 tetratricopeptide repeat domain protein [Sulfurihydrogenibium yellowstonense SS-5]